MTTMVPARSKSATDALVLVQRLQRRLVDKLEEVAASSGTSVSLHPTAWLRDGGRHGGGERWGTGDNEVFDRASVNVSQVHYDDDETRQLASATALSAIVHPRNPHAPSMHMHVSWTEPRNKTGYWRVMADLNPAIVDDAAAQVFARALHAATPAQWEHAREQGAKYFYIPALKRHRGVVHFYLEGYATQHPHEDSRLAERVGSAAIDAYGGIVRDALSAHSNVSDEERRAQLAYHTLYFLQVLTLDRGTTSGLLIHDQNDVGVLGSLPSRVDLEQLGQWCAVVPPPQDVLLQRLIGVFPHESTAVVTDSIKAALAAAIRDFYREYPDAMNLQAKGDVVPPTVANHLGPAADKP